MFGGKKGKKQIEKPFELRNERQYCKLGNYWSFEKNETKTKVWGGGGRKAQSLSSGIFSYSFREMLEKFFSKILFCIT